MLLLKNAHRTLICYISAHTKTVEVLKVFLFAPMKNFFYCIHPFAKRNVAKYTVLGSPLRKNLSQKLVLAKMNAVKVAYGEGTRAIPMDVPMPIWTATVGRF